jgi:hypothetical protein
MERVPEIVGRLQSTAGALAADLREEGGAALSGRSS